MTDTDTVELRPCPICGDTLQVTKSKMAVHSEQNRSTCILGSMGIPTDHPRTVAKWNTRAAIAALPPAVPATTPDPAESHVDGWRVRVIEWATDETVKVVQCKGEREAKKIERGMGINMASEYYTEIDNKPRTTTTTTTPDPVSEAKAKAVDDAKWYGAGFMRVLSDGTWDHIDHECISIHAPLDPNPPEVDPVSEAAKVLEQSRTARKAAFDEMWKVATEEFSLEATNSGGARYSITGDVINALWYAGLRALTKDGEAG